MAIKFQQHERGYTSITRPDSSKALRNDLRAFWGKGEQLWDVDFNSNLQFAEWWTAFAVDYCRLPHPAYPPIPENGTYKSVVRTPSGEVIAGDIQQSGDITDTLVWRPFVGAKIYVRADYAFRGWNGTEWEVLCEVPPFKPRMEISIYISAGRPGVDAAVYVVEEAFEMPPLAMFSSCRGLGGETKTAYLFKNGAQVGYFVQDNDGVASLNPSPADLSFAVGDILSIRSPVALRNATFTIVGKRL